MKVLVVDEELPLPLNTGKRIRTYNLLDRLARKHDVTFLCYGNGSNDVVWPGVDVRVLDRRIPELRGLRFYLSLFRNIFSFLPYIVVRHFSSQMTNAVTELVSGEKYDLVHCEWTPYTENIRHALPGMPSVLSTHNVEAMIWARYCENESNFLKREYIRLQWMKVKKYEKEVCGMYSLVTAVSDNDRRKFVSEYGCREVAIIPNGVDADYFSPMPAEVKPYSMVFTGSMDWRPNQDGMRYFIEEVYPLIQKELPEASLVIVGRNPPEWLREMAARHRNVIVTGTVDDVRPYIARSVLYIVPLRVGGGSRLKILEALSMEKVVLSTTVGAEGLDLEGDVHLLLRDDPRSFAECAVQALKNPGRLAHLAVQGRERADERYAWDVIANSLEDVWRKAAQ